MRALIACLASAFLSGLLAAPLSAADGPWDDIPVIGAAVDQVTDICVHKLEGLDPPTNPQQWFVTYNDGDHDGWRVWLSGPQQWWFIGLCNTDGRLRALNVCVVPYFKDTTYAPAPAPSDAAAHVLTYSDAYYQGHLVWFPSGGPTGSGSWWFFGLCPNPA